jgi:hypothetical protein
MRMNRRVTLSLVLTLLCALFFALPAGSEGAPQDGNAPDPPIIIAPVKEAAIRRLMKVSGGENVTAAIPQILQSIQAAMDKRYPPSDEHARKMTAALLRKLGARLASKDFLDQMVPIYDKFFNDEDIAAMIEFYESPAGRKMAQSMPSITQEASRVSIRWTTRAFRQALEEMVTDYPELKPTLDSTSKQ